MFQTKKGDVGMEEYNPVTPHLVWPFAGQLGCDVERQRRRCGDFGQWCQEMHAGIGGEAGNKTRKKLPNIWICVSGSAMKNSS